MLVVRRPDHELTRFFGRAKSVLKSGEVEVVLGICLASTASAGTAGCGDDSGAIEDTEDVRDSEGAFGGGHCCGLLRYNPVEGGKKRVVILEGTTRMMQIDVTKDTPLYLLKPVSGTGSPTVLTLDKALTSLSMHTMYMTQISNCLVPPPPVYVFQRSA